MPATNRTSKDDSTHTRWDMIRRLKDRSDSAAWRDFDGCYRHLIVRVAMQTGLSAADAEDIVQETFVAVSQKMAGFQADPSSGSFRSWLLQRARWLILNKLQKIRQEKQRHVDKFGTRLDDDSHATSMTDRLPNQDGNSVESLLDTEWHRQAMELALEKLKCKVNARHFQIFYLLTVKEQPPAQVCKALGVNRAQVYLVKHRLIPLFKKILREVEDKAE